MKYINENYDDDSEMIYDHYNEVGGGYVLYRNDVPYVRKSINDMTLTDINNFINKLSTYNCPSNNAYINILNDSIMKRRKFILNRIKDRINLDK